MEALQGEGHRGYHQNVVYNRKKKKPNRQKPVGRSQIPDQKKKKKQATKPHSINPSNKFREGLGGGGSPGRLRRRLELSQAKRAIVALTCLIKPSLSKKGAGGRKKKGRAKNQAQVHHLVKEYRRKSRVALLAPPSAIQTRKAHKKNKRTRGIKGNKRGGGHEPPETSSLWGRRTGTLHVPQRRKKRRQIAFGRGKGTVLEKFSRKSC